MFSQDNALRRYFPVSSRNRSGMLYLLVLSLALALSGCAALTGPGGLTQRLGQERKLSQARSLLEQGKVEAAEAALKDICAGPVQLGVTDEALFRLSLLHLGAGQDPGRVAQAREELSRLMQQYPAGSWTKMASNLSLTLTTLQQARQAGAREDSENRELKRTNRTLLRQNKELKGSKAALAEDSARQREQIDGLTREIAELRHSVEQLKTLDFELEKKHRR